MIKFHFFSFPFYFHSRIEFLFAIFKIKIYFKIKNILIILPNVPKEDFNFAQSGCNFQHFLSNWAPFLLSRTNWTSPHQNYFTASNAPLNRAHPQLFPGFQIVCWKSFPIPWPRKAIHSKIKNFQQHKKFARLFSCLEVLKKLF